MNTQPALLECQFCGVAFTDVELHARHEESCEHRPVTGMPDALPLGDVPPAIRAVLLPSVRRLAERRR